MKKTASPAVVEKAPPGRFVAVWQDARLHRRPQGDSSFVLARSRLERRRPGDVFSYRLISKRPGWLEIEPVPDYTDAHHCHGGPPALAGLRLRFFVREDDAVPVTVTAMNLRFDDGSRVEIPAGVHAVRDAESVGHSARFVLGGGDVGIPVDLMADDVGFEYEVGDSFRRKARVPPRALPVFENNPAIGGHPLVDQRATTGRRSGDYCALHVPAYQRQPNWAAHEAEKQGRIMLRGPRAKIVGEYEPGKLVHYPCTGCCATYCRGTSFGRTRRMFERLEGPVLYWPDGNRAGVAVGDFFAQYLKRDRRNGRVCFSPVTQYHQHNGASETMRLCAEERFVEYTYADRDYIANPMVRRRNGTLKKERLPHPEVEKRLLPRREELSACIAPEGGEYFSFVISGRGTVHRVRASWDSSRPSIDCLTKRLEDLHWPAGFAATLVEVYRPRQLR